MFAKLLILNFVWATFAFVIPAHAGVMEFSVGGSYSRTNYGAAGYSWTRRVGTSLGYYFLELTQLEFSVDDTIERSEIKDYQNTTFHSRTFGVNLVQQILGRQSFFQPFLKVGVGQLNREGSGTYAGGGSPNAIVDSVSGIVGAGMKLYITRTISIRAEATSYLQGGDINKWRDNISVSTGLSFMF